ncbi:MAG: inosine/xanthosine triphosphatase [Desulfurococcales archaeon]|nr:inosine/xanthosine triphosphatase [Desulfurococcales archaeon]
MKVCVGTRNPSKLKGVEKALRLFYDSVSVTCVPVESGVPPQPIGIEQIFTGARNRALRALAGSNDCDLGVGVEAGIYAVSNTYYDVQVAAVADRNGVVTYGLSPSFPIPPKFANALLAGEVPELEVIVDRTFGTSNIGEKGGLIKLLTKGRVLREDLTFYAVVMALVPRLNRELYDLPT